MMLHWRHESSLFIQISMGNKKWIVSDLKLLNCEDIIYCNAKSNYVLGVITSIFWFQPFLD